MPRVPKFQPRRTNARVGPLTLPMAGRDGPLPKWPLTGQSPSETKYWKELWKKPQAIAWEEMDCADVVALYCRLKLIAEGPGAQAGLIAQVIALSDRLGLTPKAMRLLLWQMAPQEEAIEDDGKVLDIRDRIRAVE